jgi:hypothetical protein
LFNQEGEKKGVPVAFMPKFDLSHAPKAVVEKIKSCVLLDQFKNFIMSFLGILGI